jgi:hypothetical protein
MRRLIFEGWLKLDHRWTQMHTDWGMESYRIPCWVAISDRHPDASTGFPNPGTCGLVSRFRDRGFHRETTKTKPPRHASIWPFLTQQAVQRTTGALPVQDTIRKAAH